MTFLDREDFIELIRIGTRKNIIKSEFGITEEEYNSLLRSIAIREELKSVIDLKDSEALEKLIKKTRKKDVFVDYVASVAEGNKDKFFESFDEASKNRFISLIEEYGIIISKPEKREEVQIAKPVSLTDSEVQELRVKADNGTIYKKNIFAFTLYKAGRIDEAREYLMGLVEAHGSYLAYRQLIHLEKSEGNLEDAKYWCLEAEECFPQNIGIKEVRFRIAKKEKNPEDMLEIAREIKNIRSDFTKYEEEAKKIIER